MTCLNGSPLHPASAKVVWLPPDLFNCVIDHLMCQLKIAAGPPLGIDLDNWRLIDIDYADDIALFSPSSDDLSSVLRILSKEAAKVGMSISWTNTKAMMISPSSAITSRMNIDGELVEFVPSFTYLGSIISADGSIEAEITSRIGKAAGAMKRLSNAQWKRRCISRQTKLRMYRPLVSSVLLYGSETWNLTISDCNRLNAFDMSCLRRPQNVKWYHHVRNSTIRQQTKQHPVSITLTQRRLRCFGHLQRMPPESEVLKLHNFPRAQSAGRYQEAVHDDGGWTAYLKTSQSSTFPSLRQFVLPIIASPGVLFFVVCPLRWMTRKSFKSSKQVCLGNTSGPWTNTVFGWWTSSETIPILLVG